MNIIKKTLFVSLLTVLSFSCQDRKVHVVDAHTKGHEDGFLLAVSGPAEEAELYVGQAVELKAKIRYDNQAYPSGFHLTQASNRSGILRNAAGEPIADWRTEKDGETSISFTPLEKGTYELAFRASDDFGEVQRDSLRFEVQDPPFEVAVTKQQARATFKQPTAIQLQVKNEASNLPKTLTYESSLKGVLTYDKRPYEQGESIPIGTQNPVTVQFTPEAIGTGKLKFVLSDEFGQTHRVETTPITAYRMPFTVKMDYKNTPGYVNKKGEVVLGIRDDNKPVSPKKMTFTSSIKGKLRYNGRAYEAGKTIELGTQPEVLVQFAAEEAGTAELVLTLEDGLQAPQKIPVRFAFQHIPFKMDFHPTSGEVKFCKFSELKLIDLGIKATDKVEYDRTGISYTLEYSILKGSGSLQHIITSGEKGYIPGGDNRGKVIRPGEIVPAAAFGKVRLYDYLPDAGQEKSTIEITIRDNYGQSVSQQFQINKRPGC